MKKLSRTVMSFSLIFAQSPVQAAWDDCFLCCCKSKSKSSVKRQPSSAAFNEKEVPRSPTKTKNITLELKKKSSDQVAEILQQNSIETLENLDKLDKALQTFATVGSCSPTPSPPHSRTSTQEQIEAVKTINTLTIDKDAVETMDDNEQQAKAAETFANLDQRMHWRNGQPDDVSLFNGGNQEIIKDFAINASPLALANKPTVLIATRMIARASFYKDPTLNPNCAFSKDAWILLKKKCRLPTVTNATLTFDDEVDVIDKIHQVLPNVEFLYIKAPNLTLIKKEGLLAIKSLKKITIESKHTVRFAQKKGIFSPKKETTEFPFDIVFKRPAAKVEILVKM